MDFKVDYKLEGEWPRTFAMLMTSSCRPLGGRTTGVGGSPRLSQPQIQPTHQRRQNQGNGERRHSVPPTHSEWTTEADGYIPVSWVPDFRRRWVYDGIPYQADDRGITTENMEKSQHTDFNEDTTNKSASVACRHTAVKAGLSEKMKKGVLTLLRLKDWETLCGFRGQQRKQMSGFLTKLE